MGQPLHNHHHTVWWLRNPANQFSPVVYPIIHVPGGSPDCVTISCIHDWLVVSTHLKKYESKWESSPILGVKITKIFELPPPRWPSLPIPFPSHHWSSGFSPPRKGSCQHHWSVGVRPSSRTLGLGGSRPDMVMVRQLFYNTGPNTQIHHPFFFFFWVGGGGRFLESVFVFNVEWRDDSAVEKNYRIMVLGILWLKKTMESDEWIEFLQKKSLQLWLWKRKNLTTHQLFVHQFYRVNPTNSSTWKWQLWISIVWFFWHAPKKIHLKWPGPHIFTETLAGRGEILCNSRRPPWTTL